MLTLVVLAAFVVGGSIGRLTMALCSAGRER